MLCTRRSIICRRLPCCTGGRRRPITRPKPGTTTPSAPCSCMAKMRCAYSFIQNKVHIYPYIHAPAAYDWSNCSMQPSKESSLLQLASLKQRVRQLLLKKQADELPSRLRVMDQLQSLGVAYHFEEEIRSMLTSMHVHGAHLQLKHDLCSTALLFRTLRAHGIPASTGQYM